MRIQTLSLIAGSQACNARCPYCVSRMTGKERASLENMNTRNLHKTCALARQCGTTTVMITGKGEPLMEPNQIFQYLKLIEPYSFSFIELQTNGMYLATKEGAAFLVKAYGFGLNTIAISIVSSDRSKNQKIFSQKYPDIVDMVYSVKEARMMVRLTCTMIRGCVDSWDAVRELISYCKEQGVEQLALAPVRHPYNSKDDAALGWVDANEVSASAIEGIKKGLHINGHKLMDLMHGAEVFDVEGVSVCLRDCLTHVPDINEIRQLIFYPSGRLMYDWQYEGAVLL